ncbi:hypothetical protein B1810_01245 [Panacagrimonas perspica]|nr:hypothetical protein B1810_01245 [Panacagrimonas perspica]
MIPIEARLLAAMLLGLSMTTLTARADDSDLPPTRTQGDVVYLSGGIGKDETAAIKATTSRYALTLLFATTGGGGRDAFLASVPVKIADASGKVVLDAVTDGPYLLVNLAPGKYQVSASLDGVERKTSVTLKTGVPQQRSLTWPVRAKDTTSAPIRPAAGPIVVTVAPDGTTVTTEPVTANATAVTTTTPPVQTSAVPVQANQGGVPYVSGGIGSDESAALKAQFPKYALALTFASVQNGHNVFLASVPVKILDASGATVLDVTTEGPYLLVDVPPGKYEVVATNGGKEQRASLQVTAGRTTERAFSWAAP